eukprot:gene13983-29763_t
MFKVPYFPLLLRSLAIRAIRPAIRKFLNGNVNDAVRLSRSSFDRKLNFNRSTPTRIGIHNRCMTVVTVPLKSLGDSISTAVLFNWHKQKDDQIKVDDVITVVEAVKVNCSDKVTMDMRGKLSGVFVDGLTDMGSEIQVGAPLYKIDTNASVPTIPTATAIASQVSNTTPAANQ